jgi:hypothetical protein
MMRAKESRSQVRQPCPSLSSRLFGGGEAWDSGGGIIGLMGYCLIAIQNSDHIKPLL